MSVRDRQSKEPADNHHHLWGVSLWAHRVVRMANFKTPGLRRLSGEVLQLAQQIEAGVTNDLLAYRASFNNPIRMAPTDPIKAPASAAEAVVRATCLPLRHPDHRLQAH